MQIRNSNNILSRKILRGVEIHLSENRNTPSLKIKNFYGSSASGLTCFMYELLQRKGKIPLGNKYVQMSQIKKLLSKHTPEQIEAAMLKANAVSRNSWGIKFIERLLNG